MSGVKRKIEDKDPDYEDITQVQENKRSKVVEQNGKTRFLTVMFSIIHVVFLICLFDFYQPVKLQCRRLKQSSRISFLLR